MFRLSYEDAIFRSFRDIDELINDMWELKARNAAVETELKEMHDRYSQEHSGIQEVLNSSTSSLGDYY